MWVAIVLRVNCRIHLIVPYANKNHYFETAKVCKQFFLLVKKG